MLIYSRMVISFSVRCDRLYKVMECEAKNGRREEEKEGVDYADTHGAREKETGGGGIAIVQVG